MNVQLQKINDAIVHQQAAFVGQVLSKEPQLEPQLIHHVTQGANEKDIALGKRILSQYGYTEQMTIQDQPALSGTRLPVNAAVICFLFGIPVLLLLFWEYRKLFAKFAMLRLQQSRSLKVALILPYRKAWRGISVRLATASI